MKLNAAILFVVVLLCFSLAGLLQKTAPLSARTVAPKGRATEQAPQFTFLDIAGKEYALSDYAGKIVILNFWASWCAPCITEFPHLLSFAAANPDIILIALSSDKDKAVVENFLKRLDPASRSHLKMRNIIILNEIFLGGRQAAGQSA